MSKCSPQSAQGRPVLCCNPPQCAIRHAEHGASLQAFEPGTARAKERPQNWSAKLPRDALSVTFRKDSESADEN
eukprot:14453516-Alexandrium_andersonii.AAC.1